VLPARQNGFARFEAPKQPENMTVLDILRAKTGVF
jgi:hypothetical protein